MLAEGLSENTTRRRCGIAKQFFTTAVRKQFIPANPFEELKAATITNRRRDYFVSREEAAKVIEACPDAQWRLLFTLSRYGGLRCPSEHLAMRWGDVDWEHARVTIRSAKTEHHEGGECRMIPLFPELRPYLEAVFDQAEPGTEHVITRYRRSNVNLRTQLLKIIRRAGLEAWPKLFHNLRATRQTELAEEYPAHVVCSWLGNTKGVAMKHYLQTTEEHFQKAAQNPTQTVHENDCQATTEKQQTPQMSDSDNAGQLLNMLSVGDTGFEPVTPSLSS
ncbi:MAG: tyrosine-type recombinase/integrase [Planctomycetes bacterium]|nr:tyrosine-type recombinase/integrase [Planctomycetota bacterium]